MGYALWLIPSLEEYKAWEKLMEFRPPDSSVKPNSKSYPGFAPHITLATFASLPPTFDIDKLPIYDLRPPVMKFESWKRGDTYLGALIIKLSKPRELKRLHGAITDYLGDLSAEWKSRNFPHMSVFYVDEPQERLKLEEGLKDYKQMGTFGDSGDLDLHSRFTGMEVWLVDCTRSVRQWKVMEKRSLSISRLRELRSRHTGSITLPVPTQDVTTTVSRPTEPQKRHPSEIKSQEDPSPGTRCKYHPSVSITMPAPTQAGPPAPVPEPASVPAPQITKQPLYQPQYTTTSPPTEKSVLPTRSPSRSTSNSSKTSTHHSCSSGPSIRTANNVSRPKEPRKRHPSESFSSPSPSAPATTSISDAPKTPTSPTYTVQRTQPTRYSQAEPSITAMDVEPPPVGAAPHL